ncbi:MAG: hypothetical protein WKF59_01520 [Chitinophagaceae bacterium]
MPPLKFLLWLIHQTCARGLFLKIDGSLYTVIEFGQNKTARAAAKVWAKLKGVDNNRTIEQTWNSGETIYPVRVEKNLTSFYIKMIQATLLWILKIMNKYLFRKLW